MPLIHVNVPYSMLLQRIRFVVEKRLHPEIFFSGDDLDACQEKDTRRLSDVLHQNNLEITIHGPFMDLSPGGADRKVKDVTLDRLRRTLEVASFFRPKLIVFHPGYEKWTFNGYEKLWLKSSLETWRPLVEEAGKKDLSLALENVYEDTPDSLKALLEKIDSPSLRYCFDTGHHHVFSKVPLPFWFEALGSYLAEVHLHDNHREMDDHLPVGEGGFDFDQFFALLSKHKLHPIFTIEPHQEEHLWRGLEAVKKYI